MNPLLRLFCVLAAIAVLWSCDSRAGGEAPRERVTCLNGQYSARYTRVANVQLDGGVFEFDDLDENTHVVTTAPCIYTSPRRTP